MIVLGIESSCDETAAAVVQNGEKLLSNVVWSSMDLHTVYGGVVPEIAARSHIESIIPVIEQALSDAFPDVEDPWAKIDAIAVVNGAGLGGSLLVGVTAAKELAILKNKPLYDINHVEAHIYASFLTDTAPALSEYNMPENQPEFPMLALIVSGGHSQLVLFRDHFDYDLLGQTRDDAVGEAFDKAAKIIGLPYPGGVSIAKKAENGDVYKYQLPKAKLKDDKYGFSFSGLKTATLRLAQAEVGEDYTFPSYKLPERLTERQVADIAASFRRIATETVVDKTIAAYQEFEPKSLVIAGGVAASQELRRQLRTRLEECINNLQDTSSDAMQGASEESQQAVHTGTVSEDHSSATQQSAENISGVSSSARKQADVTRILKYPDLKLCTDNGAMVATLGCFKAMHGKDPANPYSLEINPNLSM